MNSGCLARSIPFFAMNNEAWVSITDGLGGHRAMISPGSTLES